MPRFSIVITLVAALIVTAVYVFASRVKGPSIEILQPQHLVGVESLLDVTIETPGGMLSVVEMVLKQGDLELPLFSLAAPQDAKVSQESADRVRIQRSVGKNSSPQLKAGLARLLVTAERPALFGFRNVETVVERDLELQFEPPRLLSLIHI